MTLLLMAANVVYSKPRQERRAMKNLLRQGYEVFLPLCRKHRSLDAIPLFPRYLFIWIPEGKQWSPVENTPGVSKILKNSNQQLATVPAKAVSGIKERMEADGGAVILENDNPKNRTFKPGQEIHITGGTHAGLKGLYVSRSKDRVFALLHMFGRQVRATILESHIGS